MGARMLSSRDRWVVGPASPSCGQGDGQASGLHARGLGSGEGLTTSGDGERCRWPPSAAGLLPTHNGSSCCYSCLLLFEAVTSGKVMNPDPRLTCRRLLRDLARLGNRRPVPGSQRRRRDAMQHHREQDRPGDGLQEHRTAAALDLLQGKEREDDRGQPARPNQPMNATVAGRSCVPSSAIATGTILITVRLRSA